MSNSGSDNPFTYIQSLNVDPKTKLNVMDYLCDKNNGQSPTFLGNNSSGNALFQGSNGQLYIVGTKESGNVFVNNPTNIDLNSWNINGPSLINDEKLGVSLIGGDYSVAHADAGYAWFSKTTGEGWEFNTEADALKAEGSVGSDLSFSAGLIETEIGGKHISAPDLSISDNGKTLQTDNNIDFSLSFQGNVKAEGEISLTKLGGGIGPVKGEIAISSDDASLTIGPVKVGGELNNQNGALQYLSTADLSKLTKEAYENKIKQLEKENSNYIKDEFGKIMPFVSKPYNEEIDKMKSSYNNWKKENNIGVLSGAASEVLAKSLELKNAIKI